jgi:ABC-2 type transport system ATP-binding protein
MGRVVARAGTFLPFLPETTPFYQQLMRRRTRMIDVSGLDKSYGDVQALKSVSFHIAPGEIIGLLGPNGAGKTTIIKILTGYLQPDKGQVIVDGLDVLTQTQEVQERIGYLPENAPLYPELSIQAYLQMIAGLRQIPLTEQRERISEAVYATNLEEHLTRPIGELSKGFRQRVGLAQAILHKPRLLILDEPSIGLDPTQIVEIRNLIRRLSQHSTILFSTHILPEVEALCDRVIILMNGEVKKDAHLSELSQYNEAILVLATGQDEVEPILSDLEGVSQVSGWQEDGHHVYRVRAENGVDLCPALYQLASQSGWPVRELRPDVQTLETVFNELAVSA